MPSKALIAAKAVSLLSYYDIQDFTNGKLDDVVQVNISPELYDSSTIMLEGLILKKPVIQFILDDEFLIIQPLNSPIIQMNELNELIEVTEKILENETFKETIIKKIPLQIANYLSYQNSSSHKILELIEKTPD